jgi:glucokinase
VTVVGVDVGGTKIAAGVVDLATGTVLAEARRETPAREGAEAVLTACRELVDEVAPAGAAAIGVGLCEFVDRSGEPSSGVTIDWRGLDVAAALGAGARVRIESDVRAAARAEARFGAGRPFGDFVYLTVGTGISHCLVLAGEPYPGARGNAIVVGAPPVERVASGSALARLAGVARAEEVLADPARAALVDCAAVALGLALAALVNALDPEAVVVGGGLGLVDTYRERAVAAARREIDHERTRELPIVPAQLGERSGLIGAALAAAG